MKFFFNITFLLLCIILSNSTFGHNSSSPTRAQPDINCPLPPPATLIAKEITHNSVTLQWSAVPGAQLYKVTTQNLNTGLFMPAQYTTNTDITIGGLLPNTNYKFGVSASGCDLPDPNQFGPPIYLDVKTRSYIVDDLMTTLNCGNLQPRNFADKLINIPYNASNIASVAVYQAKVSGTTSSGAFEFRFSVTMPCPQLSHFYVSTNGGSQGVTARCEGSGCPVVSFNRDNITLFTLSNPQTLINSHSATITFNSDVVTEWLDNRYSVCTTLNPYNCGLGFGSPFEETSVISDAINDVEAKLTLAPNPTSDFADLSMELSAPDMPNIRLYNVLGNEISAFQPKSLVPAGMFSHRIEMSDLAAGMYFVTVQTKAGIKTEVLVKQ